MTEHLPPQHVAEAGRGFLTPAELVKLDQLLTLFWLASDEADQAGFHLAESVQAVRRSITGE